MLVIEKSLGTLDTSRGQSTIASAGAVVATGSASVDADRDKGTAVVRLDPDGVATVRLIA